MEPRDEAGELVLRQPGRRLAEAVDGLGHVLEVAALVGVRQRVDLALHLVRALRPEVGEAQEQPEPADVLLERALPLPRLPAQGPDLPALAPVAVHVLRHAQLRAVAHEATAGARQRRAGDGLEAEVAHPVAVLVVDHREELRAWARADSVVRVSSRTALCGVGGRAGAVAHWLLLQQQASGRRVLRHRERPALLIRDFSEGHRGGPRGVPLPFRGTAANAVPVVVPLGPPRRPQRNADLPPPPPPPRPEHPAPRRDRPAGHLPPPGPHQRQPLAPAAVPAVL